jgi:hypothetical protein
VTNSALKDTLQPSWIGTVRAFRLTKLMTSRMQDSATRAQEITGDRASAQGGQNNHEKLRRFAAPLMDWFIRGLAFPQF